VASEQQGAPAAASRKQYHIGRGALLPGMLLYRPQEKSLKRALTSVLVWRAKSQVPHFLLISWLEALQNGEKKI